MREVLVTGGLGFIGSRLAQRLLDEGCQVTVVDNLSTGKRENLQPHKRLRVLEEDIREYQFDRQYDTVFHLAALPRVQRSIAEPELTHDVNVNGTLSLLMEAKTNKTPRFVFSSSSSVYGDQDRLPLEETMTPNPMSPYALHKFVGEQYCGLFGALYGVSTVSLRYFNVYGPGMDENASYANLIPKAIKLISEGKAFPVNGDGKQKRDFTFVDDVVEANLLAARGRQSGIYNIGTGQNYSVLQVLDLIGQRLGVKPKLEFRPQVTEPKVTLANPGKAKEMGWEPKVSLRVGIKKL